MDKQGAYKAIARIEAEIANPRPYVRGSEFWNTPPPVRDAVGGLATALYAYILETKDRDVIRSAQGISISDVEALLDRGLPEKYLGGVKVLLKMLREVAAMAVTEGSSATSTTPPPIVADNTEAQQIWQKAIEAGFIDGQTWRGTRPQLALFAEIASEKWGLKFKWKPFENHFRVKNLAQERKKSKDYYGTIKGGDKIDSLFE
jgi:hypothetical protein